MGAAIDLLRGRVADRDLVDTARIFLRWGSERDALDCRTAHTNGLLSAVVRNSVDPEQGFSYIHIKNRQSQAGWGSTPIL